MNVKTYRKKPVAIEAVEFTADETSEQEQVARWCNGKLRGVGLKSRAARVIQIETLEGEMEARVGDFIIKGVQGEFYPCKPEIFAKTYEEATDAS